MSRAHTTVHCPLRQQALQRGDACAIFDHGRWYSFHELHGRTNVAVSALRAQGVGAGDRVALLLPSGVDVVCLLLALARLRAVACGINLRDASAVQASRIRLLDCSLVVNAGGGPVEEGMCADCRSVDALFADVTAGEGDGGEEPSATALFSILFTSGSTGHPRAVAHRFCDHLSAARGSNQHNGLTAEDRWMLSLPCYHVGGVGIMFRCLTAGAAMVVPERDASMLETLRDFGITHLSVVATQLARLLDAFKGEALPVRSILLGGGPAPDSLVDRAFEAGLPVFKTYGMTEMASQITTVPPCAEGATRYTSGLPLPGIGLRVAESGEVLVRGPGQFSGYLEGHDIHAPFDENRWFATGDLGRLDADGYLSITGRRDNMFISGGENIQPEEVERVLCEHADVADALVVPVEDREFGFRPFAFVVGARREGAGNDSEHSASNSQHPTSNAQHPTFNALPGLEELNDWLGEKLGRHKTLVGMSSESKVIQEGRMKVDRVVLQDVAARLVGEQGA